MLKNCILMMMRWKDLQKFIKNGCNRDPKLFTLTKVCLVYERIIYDRSDVSCFIQVISFRQYQQRQICNL